MKQYWLTSGVLALSMAAWLSGCGSTSSSDSTSDSSGTSVTIAGSYYEGAHVYCDEDGDEVHDTNEENTTSNSSGVASLSSVCSGDIVAELKAGTKKNDEDGNLEETLTSDEESFILSQEAIAEGQSVISSITTLVHQYLQDGGAATFAAAKTAIANELGVSENDLFVDFNIESNSTLKSTLKTKSADYRSLLNTMGDDLNLSSLTKLQTYSKTVAIPSRIDLVDVK